MKEKILGFDVISYDEQELLKRIFSDKEKKVIVNINPFIIMNFYHSLEYQKMFNEEKYQIPDGYGIVWASKHRKHLIRERITGIDLMQDICKIAEEKQQSIFLCGSKAEIVKQTVSALNKTYPNFCIKGYIDGYQSEEEMIEKINESNADILFVALGSPKQEEFIFKNKKNLNPNLIMPVGGSFDVISGVLKRAPKFYQVTHCEWLYRMIKEPKRIRRNLSLIKFVFLVLLNKK